MKKNVKYVFSNTGFNQSYLVQRYISGIFMKIRSVAFTWSCASRQTDRQTDKRRIKHNFRGGDDTKFW